MNKNALFQGLIFSCSLIVPLLVLIMFFSLLSGASLVLERMGLKFFFTSQWNPVTGQFGSFTFLVGTLLSSLLALLVSIPFSLSISIALGEVLKGTKIAFLLTNLVEIISAIPSVVIGFWALLVVVPWVQEIQKFLGLTPYGTGLFSASLVLSFMIIPFSASLGKEVLELVPVRLKEGAFALGSSRQEVIWKICLPYCRAGFVGGFILAAGRAIGETMAVTMLIGNVNNFPQNIFAPTNTMASVIANEFTEASENDYYSALLGIALFLLLFSSVFSLGGRWLMRRLVVN